MASQSEAAVPPPGRRRAFLLSLCFLLFGAPRAVGQAPAPILYFSDLTSGPSTGSSDSSGGRVPGRDGAIATIWGRNLGRSLSRSRTWSTVKPTSITARRETGR